MISRQRQQGATLVISLIMLVVLTLLVVYSIRASNTNLRIAGNMQHQAEANSAAQQAIEQVIEQIKVTDNMATIAEQSVTVSMAGVTYTVTAKALSTQCVLEVPVLNSELNAASADDVPCFESQDGDYAIKADGSLTTKPSACKQQTWEIEAAVNDSATGANLTQVQGLAVRAPATVACPG